MRRNSKIGAPVIGGERGMMDGFAGIFGDAKQIHIVVSEEAGGYRPEMEWLTQQLNAERSTFNVQRSTFTDFAEDDAVYRFFELFDLENIRTQKFIFEAWAAGEVAIAPPMRAFQEEKLALALFHHHLLQAGQRGLQAAGHGRVVEAAEDTRHHQHLGLCEVEHVAHFTFAKDRHQRVDDGPQPPRRQGDAAVADEGGAFLHDDLAASPADLRCGFPQDFAGKLLNVRRKFSGYPPNLGVGRPAKRGVALACATAVIPAERSASRDIFINLGGRAMGPG